MNNLNNNKIKTGAAKTGAICLALAIPLTMMGCSGKDVQGLKGGGQIYTASAPAYTNDVALDYEYDAGAGGVYTEASPAYEEATTGAGYEGGNDSGTVLTGNQVTSGTSRKLITTINVTLETENFDEMMAALKTKLAEVGGYVENEYTYNGSTYDAENVRYSSVTVRVPEDKTEAFVGDVTGTGNLVSKTTNTQDVTLNYVDTEGKKEMYLAEEKSLLELLEKAETVEDISYLVSRLSEVRYNIETMESTLRTYDDLVDYATINFDIQEVKVYTPTVEKPQTTGEKLSQEFNENLTDVLESFRDFGVGLVANSPYIIRFLLISGIIVGTCFLVIKGIVKKIKKKAAARKAAKEAATQTKAVKTEE